jgi:hypothetical protein
MGRLGLILILRTAFRDAAIKHFYRGRRGEIPLRMRRTGLKALTNRRLA